MASASRSLYSLAFAERVDHPWQSPIESRLIEAPKTSIRARALLPNHDEVASIHRIPVEEFLHADKLLLGPVPGSEHPVLRMPVGEN